MYSTIKDKCILGFIQTGLVMQIIYFKFLPEGYNLEFMENKYEYFTKQWYLDIGLTVT